MGRKREFKGKAAQQAMARFLVDVTESVRSMWAEYLNGSKLIPKHLLGQVLMEVRRRRKDHWRGGLVAEANALWKSANEGTTAPRDSASTELVSVYRKLAENAVALRKAQEVEMRSDRVISLMNQRASEQEMQIAGLEREMQLLQEKERERVVHHLEQARFRLTRIEDELERARSDRYTVEQARRALLRERQEICREFERLRQVADDLTLVETEPTSLPELLTPGASDEEVDRTVDEELNRISTDREQRGIMLSEILDKVGLEPETKEDGPRILSGTVVSEQAATPGPAHLPGTSGAVEELSKTMPAAPYQQQHPPPTVQLNRPSSGQPAARSSPVV